MKFASCSFVFAFAVGLVSLACTSETGSTSSSPAGGGSSSGGSSGTGSSTRTGVTECGAQQCQAGQYCLNLICETGCGSDNNCAGNQSCVKPSGEDVGSCQNATTTSAPTQTKDCAAYEEKCTACGETAADCTASCKVITAGCIECVVSTSGCELDACKATCGAQ